MSERSVPYSQGAVRYIYSSPSDTRLPGRWDLSLDRRTRGLIHTIPTEAEQSNKQAAPPFYITAAFSTRRTDTTKVLVKHRVEAAPFLGISYRFQEGDGLFEKWKTTTTKTSFGNATVVLKKKNKNNIVAHHIQ